MTRRSHPWLVGALLWVALLATPRHASAFLGWIENLSGPGPFFSVQLPFDRVVCVIRDNVEERTEAPRIGTVFHDEQENVVCTRDGNRDPRKILAHLSFEFTYAWAGTDDLFPAVRFASIKPVFFIRLHESLDAGVGLGLTRFSGDGFGLGRVSIPLRLRIHVPWLPPESKWRAVYLSLQGDYYPKAFRGSDFAGEPAFFEDNEIHKGVLIGMDLVRILGRRLGPKD